MAKLAKSENRRVYGIPQADGFRLQQADYEPESNSRWSPGFSRQRRRLKAELQPLDYNTPSSAHPVTKGLPATFRLLTKTKNEAAVALLIPALDSPNVTIQDEALQALLDRHSVAGQREIVRRLHEVNPRWEAIIDERHGRMTAALRDAVLATDLQLCQNGCRAALWFHEYDLMPALINAAEDESNPNRQLVAETLLKLAELLYDELASPRDYRNRRDPQLVRQHVLASLEQSVLRFSKHRIDEVIEAFLLLVHRDNTTLRQILADPLDPSYRPIVEVLSHSPRGGIIRLVLSFLDDSHAPSAAITILARRGDERFVEMPDAEDRQRAVGGSLGESQEDRQSRMAAERARAAGETRRRRSSAEPCNWPCDRE